MDDAAQFVPNPQVLLTELGDGTAVLLHLETKFYYTLNATGAFVWRMLTDESCRTAGAIAARLTAEFDVTPDHARHDVTTLLTEMAHENLVAPAPR